MMRTFIAITLSEQIREGLRSQLNTVQKIDSGVKWVKPENIHLTLKFLGDVEENSIDSIVDAINESVIYTEHFELSVQKAGAFPNMNRPKVLWVGINKGKERIIEFASKIDQHLFEMGFEKEKHKFSPHITIGRVKYLKNINQITSQLSRLFKNDEAMIVKDVKLIKSILKPSGAEYTPLHVTQLKDG